MWCHAKFVSEIVRSNTKSQCKLTECRIDPARRLRPTCSRLKIVNNLSSVTTSKSQIISCWIDLYAREQETSSTRWRRLLHFAGYRRKLSRITGRFMPVFETNWDFYERYNQYILFYSSKKNIRNSLLCPAWKSGQRRVCLNYLPRSMLLENRYNVYLSTSDRGTFLLLD